MEFTEIEQLTQDIDWFAVDESEEIAHFASAGKLLPKSIAASREDSERVREFFRSLSTNRTAAMTDSQIDEFVQLKGESLRIQYLVDFQSMSRRGLYSYDTPLEADRSSYFRVSCPLNPLKLAELPDDIRTIVERTRITSSFKELKLLVNNDIT